MLLRRLRNRLVEGLVKEGVPLDRAQREVGQLGDGTLLRWLLEHGPQIAELVKALLALLAFADSDPAA